MNNKTSYSRKANLSIKLSEFEMPPMQDLLIIGNKAGIGPEAVRRMAEAISPEQFTIIRFEHPRVEGVLIRKALLDLLDEETLMSIIMEEADKLINETMVLRAELKITVTIQREVDLK